MILTRLFLVMSCCCFASQPLYSLSQGHNTEFATIGSANQSHKNLGIFAKTDIVGLYSYTDFDFNSTSGSSFNLFKGHSNLYSIGADRLFLMPSLYTGVYVFRADTHLNSQALLPGTLPVNTTQSVTNDTIYGHLYKTFSDQLSIDFAGAFGQNHSTLVAQISSERNQQLNGYGNYNYSNWFTSLYGVYAKPWKKIVFKTTIGALYSQINQGGYFLTFNNISPEIVQALTNKATYIIENFEIDYPYNDRFIPFVSGGLLQVAQYTNSRSLINNPINGTFPQLNLDQNGFRLAVGFLYKLKHFSLRVEEKYFNGEGIYTNAQTIIGLDYQFG